MQLMWLSEIALQNKNINIATVYVTHQCTPKMDIFMGFGDLFCHFGELHDPN